MKAKITKEIIEEQYIRLHKNHRDIAIELKVSNAAVRKAIKRYGYKVKPNPTNIVENLSGERFGHYTVIEYYGRDRANRAKWLCECDCGVKKVISGQSLRQKNNKHCDNCRKLHYGEIHSRYFNNLKNKAISREIEFSISGDYIWNLFLKQNRKCRYSGLELNFVADYKRNHKEQIASLDRIDSSKGYIVGNVQWVHKTVNFMKQALSENEFINWCKIIANFNSNK